MVFIHLLLYIISFVFIWFGAGLIISSASRFSSKLKLSPFAFSFVFLGLLTSTPEFSVGLRAVADQKSEIFVGNLLGGIVVLFLVVIPVLAVFGNGISLRNELDRKTLLATLGVIVAPAFFILDKTITPVEGWMFIAFYLILLFVVQRKNGIFDTSNAHLLKMKAYSYTDLLKIILGVGIVFIASNVIVEKTVYFAELLHISAFYISLLVIALGTDLPELSLAVRSVISGKREVAMGDYIGAAAVSTLLFGIFTVLHNGEIVTGSNFLITFVFIAIALVSFYLLATKKQYISRNHGLLLLGVYFLFIVFELMG